MRFFVPHVNDLQGQEALYRLVRGNIESQITRVADRRLFRIEFRHGGRDHQAEVGKPDPLFGDDVFVILVAADRSAFYICTPSRGMFNDQPISVPSADVLSAEEFDTP